MRVITGSAKGYKLKAPKGIATRPTTDRVKESLFNIINVYPNDIILDLFSGSGSVGIEFLSRGASKCFFVDDSNSSYKIILENINKTNFKDKSEVFNIDFKNAIDIFRNKNLKFHYIFLDPPYDKNLINTSIKLIINNDLLENDGIIIAEHEKELKFNDFNNVILIETRNYGSSSISFFKKQEE